MWLDHWQPEAGLQEPGWKGGPIFVSDPLGLGSCPYHLQAEASWKSGFNSPSLGFLVC